MPYTIDREIEDVKAQQIKAILGKQFITKILEADLQEGQDFGIYSVKPFNVGVRLRRFEHFIKDARAHDMTKFCFGHVQKIVYCIMPRQCFAHEQKIIDCIMKSMFDTCVEDHQCLPCRAKTKSMFYLKVKDRSAASRQLDVSHTCKTTRDSF